MTVLTFPLNRDAVQVIRAPRSTDAIGAALRGAFGCPSLPDDMTRLVRRIGQAY